MNMDILTFIMIILSSFGIFSIILGIATAYLGRSRIRISGGLMILLGLIVTVFSSLYRNGLSEEVISSTVASVIGTLVGIGVGIALFLVMIIKIP